jgi:pyruvate dehydrogenase E2 component (dihydrolipoamide acetyltransferase)
VKTARIGGRAFTYTDEGEGEVVVALHGLPGSVRDWRWLAPALGGVRLVRLDLPGFGGTPARTGPGSSLEARTRFVLAALDALGIDRFVVAGHSMGGPLAMSIATSSERASGLALLASVGLRPHRLMRKVGRHPDLPRLFDLPLVGRLLRPPLRAGFLRAGFPASTTDAAILQSMRVFSRLSFPAIRAAAAGVRCPTLLAWAEDDPLIEGAIGLELARALPPGPRIAFPDGGHNIQKTRAVELGEAIAALAITSGRSATYQTAI